jgi:hypothetical protein
MLLRLVVRPIRREAVRNQPGRGPPRRIPSNRGNGGDSRSPNPHRFRRELAARGALAVVALQRVRERAREIERLARTRLSLYLSFFLRRRGPGGGGGQEPATQDIETLSLRAKAAPSRGYPRANNALTATYDAPNPAPRRLAGGKGPPIPSRSPRYLRQGHAYICARCGARFRVLDSARKHFKRHHADETGPAGDGP